MPEQKHTKRNVRKALKRLLTLLIVGVVALVGWIYLVPMITADAVTVYASYTTETGDILTNKSFSASLSVKKSETFSTSEECTVRAMYVQAGDEVKKGDQLLLLSTGDLFTASFDGVVNETRVSEGDWLWPNFQVMQVCDLEHLEVSMNVDEYDVKELSVGQECTVSVISLGVDFETVIAHINRVSQSQGTVAYYSVACDLTVPANVLPGMQATVTMPSDAVQGVTTLDMAALSFDEDKQAYVLEKQSDGTYEKTYVKTGLSDGMKVEIQSGLTAGQTVYVITGTESVQAAFSLEDIYRSIVGQSTVINDMSSRGGPGGAQSGEMPTGEMPTGDMPTGDMPQLTSTDAATSATQTEGEASVPAETTSPEATDTTVTDGSTSTDAVTQSTQNSTQPSSGAQPPAQDTTAETATPTTTDEGGTNQ